MSRPQGASSPAGIHAGHGLGTTLGFAALLLWGSSVALQRSIRDAVGPIGAAAAVYGACALIAGGYLIFRRGELRRILALPRKFLWGCGSIFVAYVFLYYLGVGLATGRQQAIEAGTINYIWTAATVVFSVPVLGKRARWTLIPGAGLALGGIVLATLPEDWSAGAFLANLRGNWLPYALSLLVGLSWGLYSTLSRRWAPPDAASPVPVFLIASGLAAGTLWLFLPAGEAHPTARTWCEVAFMAVAVTSAGYVFWDIAMRRGNLVLVASASYFTPLLSAGIGALYLKTWPGRWLWIGCALVVAGAVICKHSVREPEQQKA